MIALSAVPAASQTPRQALAGIGFLTGRWASGSGTVADTGQSAAGSSVFTPEAGGAALLRRDRTQLTDASGRPAGTFEQIMLIYPEGGTLHADYSDGQHVIHYTSATIEPGRSVTFASAAQPGAPVFRLAYTLTTSGRVAVSFGMTPPGGAPFRPIATGTLTRAP